MTGVLETSRGPTGRERYSARVDRIEECEPDRWPGKPSLIARSRELARTIPTFERVDLAVRTEDRSPEEVATQIRDEMRSRGLVHRPSPA